MKHLEKGLKPTDISRLQNMSTVELNSLCGK